MNRRQFVYGMTWAAGTLMFARASSAFAAAAPARYDLIIKGGRVIDPSMRISAIRDVGIAGGRIAAVVANIKTPAAETIDARGKPLGPGRVDVHTQSARSKEGPGRCLAEGGAGRRD